MLSSLFKGGKDGKEPVEAKESTDRFGGPPEPHLDTLSFPCIATNSASETLLQEIRDVVKKENPFLPGSAPTAVLQANGIPLADYRIDPRALRSGKEHRPFIGREDDERRWNELGKADIKHNFMSEAVVGSLPRGLSFDERSRIIANTPASPIVQSLQAVSEEAVQSRGKDGKTLRRHVLSGSWMVFVTAGYSGKRFIFEKAHELGVNAIVLDGPDSWIKTLVDQGIVKKFLPINFEDVTAVFDKALSAIQQLKHDENINIDGILTFSEIAVPLASRLAERLAVPGNPPDAVDNARDKSATRRVMANAGLPTPRNMLIAVGDDEDVYKAGEHVGYPAVIKPIFGAASLGVVRVNCQEDLLATYKKVKAEMNSVTVKDGAMMTGDPDAEETDEAQAGVNTTLMLEEYLDGPEVDVDLVFSEGRPVFGAVTDNWPTVEPYFNETGSNCPSILPIHQQRELIILGVQSVQCLGFTMGVFHVELKYTSRGPRLIEVNCRMGGGPVRNTILMVWGVDLVEEHLLTAAGIPSRPNVAPQPLHNIAEYSVNADVTGIIENIDFLEPWEQHPDVIYARPLVSVGEKVICVKDGLPTWVAEIMVKRPTVDDAIKFVIGIYESLKLPIRPEALKKSKSRK